MFALAFWLMLAGARPSHPKMPELSRVTAISITVNRFDEWLSWRCDHLFKLEDSVWLCATTIAVDGVPDTVVCTDTVASSLISTFTSRLETVRPKSRPYNPTWTHSELLVRKRICLLWANDSIVYDTWSQSKTGKPWQVIIGTDTLVSKSSAIHESLELLKPYFHEKLLDSLVKARR